MRFLKNLIFATMLISAATFAETTTTIIDRDNLKITRTKGSVIHLGNTYTVAILWFNGVITKNVFRIIHENIPGVEMSDELNIESGNVVMNKTCLEKLPSQVDNETYEGCFYRIIQK